MNKKVLTSKEARFAADLLNDIKQNLVDSETLTDTTGEKMKVVRQLSTAFDKYDTSRLETLLMHLNAE
jgi:hypothetical protein